MESTDCSREYLKSLPQQIKDQKIQQWIGSIKRYVIENAQKGFTSCVFTLQPSYMPMNAMPCNEKTITLNLPNTTVSNEELIDYLTRAFRDCKVSINEVWNEVQPGLKRQTTELVIDWL
jgi:hypothetical protein